jgi:2-desacetyl-2-hydroxyethyl bacteriochlorophyllide A dehydrogenase
MKALVWRGPRRLGVEDVAEPSPPAGTALVSVAAAAVCGSDVTGYTGSMGNRVPGVIMGHEIAATVERVGDGVDPALVGSLVAINPLVSCGACAACRDGVDNLCTDHRLIGVQLPGGFAERLVAPASNLVAMSPGTTAEAAATVEPLAQACHDLDLALASPRRGPASSALVIGAGAIGLLIAQVAVLRELPSVAVLEPNARRRESARSFGASPVFASAAEVGAHLGGSRTEGFDVVFDAVGSAATRQSAVTWTRRGGTVIAVGLHDDAGELRWREVIRREVAIKGAYCYSMRDFRLAASWIDGGRAGLPGSQVRVPLTQGPEVFRRLAAGPTDHVRTYLAGPGQPPW